MRKFYYLWLLALFTCWQLNAQGNTCNDPIVVSTFPYSTTDDTSNYGDDYGSTDRPALGGEQYAIGTGSGSYLTGDDVVYSLTPAADGVYSVEVSGLSTWSSVWVFEGCPFTSIVARYNSSAAGGTSFPALQLVGGTTYYIVISTYPAPQSTAYTLNINEVACSPVTDITASGITTTEATISWVAGDAETMWNLEYGAAGFTQGTGTVESDITPNPTFALTGLSPSSSYDVYIQSNCGNGDLGDWVGPFSFNTECGAVSTFPFCETFNSDSPTKFCWSVNNANGDSDEWNLSYTVNEHEGDGVAAMYTDFNSGANNDYLITPQLTLTGNERLKFWYRVQSSGEPNNFEVLLSTSDTDPASFTNVILPDADYSNTTYIEQIIDLSAYSGDVYIAFHVPAGGLDGWRLYIDDVCVEEIPSCIEVTDVAVSDISPTEANVSWTADSSNTMWNIEYGETGFTQGSGTMVSDTTDNPYMLTGLTPGTEYDVYIQPNCGGTLGVWEGPVTFQTLYSVDCAAAPLNFTHCYGNNDTTTWSFTAADGTSPIQIVFNAGGIESCCDDIIIYDGLDNTGTILYQDNNGGDLTGLVVTSPSGNLFFEIDSDGSVSCSSGSSCCTSEWDFDVQCQSQEVMDFANLQSFVITDMNGDAQAVTEIETCQTVTVYAQAYEPGITDADAMAAGTGVEAWIAMSSDDTDPSTWDDALWVPATYNVDVGNNDEFSIEVSGLAAGSYYFASRWSLDSGPYVYGASGGIYDGTTNTNAVLTVVEPAVITASADVMEICQGESATLTASSDDTTYTYEWDNEAGSGASVVVMPTESTTYTVTGTNEAGCVLVAEVMITVNPTPAEIVVDPVDPSVCSGGDPIALTATGGGVDYAATVLFTEGFDDCALPTDWSTETSTGTDTDPVACGSGLFSFDCTDGSTFSGPANDNFSGCIAAINDDDVGSVFQGTATITSSVMGEEAATDALYYLKYDYTFDAASGCETFVEVFDGTDWQLVKNYSVDEAGSDSLDITSYMNDALQVRWRHDDAVDGTSAWGWGFGFDNVEIARLDLVDGPMVWSPPTGLFTDAEATTAYAGEELATVYALPTEETTYTVTSSTDLGCSSSTEVTVTVNPAAEMPTAEAQSFCADDMSTVADLVATGDNLEWYDAAVDGNMLMDTEVLETASYYVQSVTAEGCASERVEVMVTVNENPDAPMAEDLIFCSADMPTVSDLMATGDNLEWYDAETDGNLLVDTDPLTTGTSYYVQSVSAEGCTSARTEVAVTINDTPDAPTATTFQEFCGEDAPTVADLVASGTGTIVWYDAATEGNVIADTEALVEGMSYFAAVVSAEDCESVERATVVVNFDADLCTPDAPENDDCGNAEMVEIDAAALPGTTAGSTIDPTNTCDATLTGSWYTVVGDGSNVTVTVTPASNWDPSLTVLEGTCAGGLTCTDNGVVDNAGMGEPEAVTFPSEEGVVYYIMTGYTAGAEGGDFAIHVTSNLGIEDIQELDNSIALYPNPVVDILHLNVDQPIRVAQVFSLDGRLVKEATNLSENTINVHNLQTGTYLIRIILDDQSVFTEQFIKK